VADDACILQQPVDGWFAEAGNLAEIEIAERRSEVLALPLDREPREPGLEALETDLFEESTVVERRAAPLAVVVVDIVVGITAPPTPHSPITVVAKQVHEQAS
jgi:hypothetical protein